MEAQKRVFWYCEKWQVGGIQKIQINLLPFFDTSRIHFDIAVSEDDTSLFDENIARAGARKIQTLDRRFDSPGKRTVANFFAVRRILRDGHYDAAHFNVCHGVELSYLFWAWVYRVPVRIVHCRNNDIGSGGWSRPIKILCHHICKRVFSFCANERLANSDLAAEWLFTRGALKRGRVKILPNGIDIQKYTFSDRGRRETRRRLGLEGAFVVGNIGHFSYQKNHEFLLDVFAELHSRRSNAVLLLVGQGEREPEIRKRTRELGLDDAVVFFGVTDDISPLLWAMDAFVLPSRFEGFGNVLLEAQAAGLPCFASKDVIPSAVAVTELMHWIPLTDAPGDWAERILNHADAAAIAPDGPEAGGPARKDCSRAITDAGYSIEDMAGYLENLYLQARD